MELQVLEFGDVKVGDFLRFLSAKINKQGKGSLHEVKWNSGPLNSCPWGAFWERNDFEESWGWLRLGNFWGSGRKGLPVSLTGNLGNVQLLWSAYFLRDEYL